MADFNNRGDLGTDQGRWANQWNNEDRWWRENYANRPYVSADRGYDYYGPAYRYGYETANQYRGRNWNEVEPQLRGGWDRYEHKSKSTWDEIKDAVKDAWDHVTGHEHESHMHGARTDRNPS